MTFEVTMKKGLGGPYYVEAENAEEAAKVGLSKVRYHQTAMNNWTVVNVVAEVKVCNKTAVQYA